MPRVAEQPASMPTPAVVERALAGNRVATEQLLAFVRTTAGRYCRARIGRHDGAFEVADSVAREVCHAVLAALPGWWDSGKSLLAQVYRTAQQTVDRVGIVPCDGQRLALLSMLPTRQREVLVLLVVVGLSHQDVAAALGCRLAAVRTAHRQALRRLSTASSAGRPAHDATGLRPVDTS